MELARIKSKQQACEESVKQLLEKLLIEPISTVLIVGLESDGTVHVRFSAVMDTLKTLGALEVAKHDVLQAWTKENGS